MIRRTIATLLLASSLAYATPAAAHHTSGRCPQYHALFARHGLPVDTFSYLAWRESRCIPGLISTTNDYGLLQLNGITWRDMAQRPHLWGDTARRCKAPWPSAALQTTRNVCVAAQLYRISGLSPWGL